MKTFLNILPEERKKRMHQNRIFRFFLKEKFIFFLIILFLLFGFFLLWSSLKSERIALENAIQNSSDFTKFQEIEKYEKSIREINREVSFVERAFLLQPIWSEVLFALTEAVEGNIRIQKIALGNENSEITGTVSNREELLAFEKRLEESDCFSSVSIPLSDLAQRENITFHMYFTIEESCLQK